MTNRPFIPIVCSLLVSFFLSCVLQAQRVGPIKVNASNARLYRDSLILRTFGPDGFPYDIHPDSVITNTRTLEGFDVFPYADMVYPAGNLDSVDKLVVTVDSNTQLFPEKLNIYLLHPHQSNGKLFIYHSGHCTSSAIGEDILNNSFRAGPGVVIPALLDSGYTVLAVPMFDYMNRQPSGYVCGFNNHNSLFADSLYAYPLALFFKPLIAALNQLDRSSFSDIYMMGLSGGGWMSSVYPAMDSSVSMSFPVAGSWPMALRSIYYSDGDAEQYYPPVFKKLLDYHELYTLSCLAPPRKMLQVNNRYDACCFNGSFQHVFYVDSVDRALAGSGGLFRYYLDETGYRHAVTPRTMQVILRFIADNNIGLSSFPEDTVTRGQNYSYSFRGNFPLLQASDSLVCSDLKTPDWMYVDFAGGRLFGQVPSGTVLPYTDTISFKAEDSLGRFVIYSYRMVNKRSQPYFFTSGTDSQTVYMIPCFSNSIRMVSTLSRDYFHFSNPSLSVTAVSVMNNSIIKLRISNNVTDADSILYNGFAEPYALTYANGQKMDDFGLTAIDMNKVMRHYAVPGMIRFNTDTRKFEYFNGNTWINMNR